MSALTAHIAVLRAEAEALNRASSIKSIEGLAISVLLSDLASAKTRAADRLEAEEREREVRAVG